MKISLKIWVIAALIIVVIAGVAMALNSFNNSNQSLTNNYNNVSNESNQSYSLKWYNNLDSAISEAQKTNKLVFAFFSANWCPACQQLESETLVNEKVTQKLSQNYVAVKIDVDTNPELSSKYGIYSIPTLIIMNSNGEEIKKIEGYKSPDQLLSAL
ncbi:MAG: thioredoxin family protein [Methanobacteriaceae archaeon]|jgi:thiol:disulfide interchange protein DsbD|nr:thioredoxin family protein [Methanobacteriaceae archaeon]MDO9627438.1 thioredoxin family protein [Methanobacteriaceae archaeon]